MLPFHYPLLRGRDDLSARAESSRSASRRLAHDYYLRDRGASRRPPRVRHLRALAWPISPGFEERGETGVEAIDSFVASFDDPGARRRADAAVRDRRASTPNSRRRYRGLAPRIDQAQPRAGRAAQPARAQHDAGARRRSDSSHPANDAGDADFTAQAAECLRARCASPGADVLTSARQAGGAVHLAAGSDRRRATPARAIRSRRRRATRCATI